MSRHEFSGCCGDYPGHDLRIFFRRQLLTIGEPGKAPENFIGIDPMREDDQLRTQWSWEFERLMKERVLFRSGRVSYWSQRFEGIMRSRLRMGGQRYGWLGSPDKSQYDRLKDVHNRVDRYKKTGDPRHLADVANFALLEFVEGDHYARHLPERNDLLGSALVTHYVRELYDAQGIIDIVLGEILLRDDTVLQIIEMLANRFKLSYNLALLADIASLAMIEFINCRTPLHLLPDDDGGKRTDIRIET